MLISDHLYGLAEDNLMASLTIDKNQPEIIQQLLGIRMIQCKWPLLSISGQIEKKELKKQMAPLTVAAYSDDPMLQLCTSYAYNKKVVGRPQLPITTGSSTAASDPRIERLRIGYLSSDLYGHAIGSLMAEVFGLHDRNKVEISAYYYGPRRSDYFQSRIIADVDKWIDIGDMSDKEAACQISNDKIDILVDVNGHSMNARTKMLSLRPAPIIVNWLGYPGSMGSIYHNYIISDDYIIPKEYEIFYSEKVMRLPCYQPNDRKRIVSPVAQSRHENGLPDDVFVYCCFNGSQKTSPFVFRLWMDILRQVPNSVLWLLGNEGETNNRLKAYADSAGISSERLIFAERKPNPAHMARYPLSDLFLDTFPYGAHTTSSDSLWMGVPVLTLSGHSFASRVCGSLVRSAGVEELICNSPEEYVSKAVELGVNIGKLAQIKEKILCNKSTCVLFDMPLLVRSLEGLYDQMWDDFSKGNLHKPDLYNLDIYHEIGTEIDHDSIDFSTLREYTETYRTHLACTDSFSPVKPDQRLWSE
jgi:predicted O-linked N-acetylglucosamine transferase (SPINDLY family)